MLALGCGPTTEPLDGGGEGGGSSGQSTSGGDDEGVSQSGSGGGEGSGDTTGADGDSSGAVGTTGEVGPCLLAVRIDLCCNQAVVATPEEVAADTCLVPWPIDVPENVWDTCIEMQPDVCRVVDCDYSGPPTENIALSDDGTCVFVCPEGEAIAYANEGCEFPFAECLPPPPPCAMDYCSCDGETVLGCGHLSEPWAHVGACE